MSQGNARLEISIPTASFDGLYHGRYPHGDAPAGAVLQGAASDAISASASLTTGSSGGGFLLPGHSVAAKQAMMLVYPRPDTETNTFARHRWAYYDAVNPVQYQIPLGITFGRFPYIFSLQSGPPGMSIGASTWNTSWASFQDAIAAGYGELRWTPTGVVSSATVSVLVTDQDGNTLPITFTVSTSSSTTRFIFLDSVHGNDATGTGSISAPWATFVKANGATYATTVNGGAICYMRAGTYAIPPQSDSGGGSGLNANWITLQVNTTRKPSAFIGFPGDTPPVLTMTQAFFGAAQNSGVNDAEDLFMQGLNPNGYNTSQINFRFFWGTQGQRLTFDGNQWSNSGFGTGADNNATGYFIDGAGGGEMSNVFIRGCSETNRQSGNAGNNYPGCSFYSVTGALVEGCFLIDPTVTVDEAWQPKSAVQNGCWRGNTTIVASCQYAYSPLQDSNTSTIDMKNVEICYNRFMGGGSIAVPVTSGYTYGALWAYRNSIQGNNGYLCATPNAGGPFSFEASAVQTSGAQPSGSAVVIPTPNHYVASGLLDSNCNLQPAFSSLLGTVGAQIQ